VQRVTGHMFTAVTVVPSYSRLSYAFTYLWKWNQNDFSTPGLQYLFD